LHRLRSTWLATRTARLNTLRGLLREFGIFIPIGAQHVVPRVRALLLEPTGVPTLLHTTLAAACDEIDVLDANMSLQRWALCTEQRRGHNVTALAIANKLARIVWAVWTPPRPFASEYRRA
jgi:hypothetical protein